MISKPPILNYNVKSGKIKISYKKNLPKISRDQYIEIRGGSFRNIIDPQSERFKSTTLYILSYPENMPIYLDFMLMGYTPLLIDNIIPGEKIISINKKNKHKVMIEPGKDNVLIRPQDLKHAQKEFSIWDYEVSEKNFLNPICGICFENIPQSNLNEWIGLYSYPFDLGIIKISGEIFSNLERGEGEIIIGIIGKDMNNAFYLSEEKLSFFDFMKSTKSKVDYNIITNLESPIDFKIEINSNKKSITYIIHNRKLQSFYYNEFSEIRLYIESKNKYFNNMKIIKDLNIEYD
jgi:hypothetical protein